MKQPILNGILESPFDLNGYGFVNIGGLLGTFQAHSAVLDTLAATSPSSAGIQILQFAAPGVDSLLGLHSNGTPYYVAGTAMGDVTSTESVSVDGQIALFNGTSGKQIRKATPTGIAKLAGGVLATVAAPTGNLVGHDDAQTLYNKTLALTLVADVGLNFQRPSGAGTIQFLAQGGASNLAVYLPAVSGTLITGAEAAAAYVPTSRTVNGHALSGNVTVTPTDLGLVIGTNVQAWSANLDTYSGIAPSTNAQTLLGHTFSQMRTDLGAVPETRTVNGHALSGSVIVTPTDLGLVIGTNVQAYDADLTTWSGLTPSANAQSLVTAANYSAMRSLLGLVIGTNVQAWNAGLDSLAAASGTNTVYYRSAANTWSAATIGAGLDFSGGVLRSSFFGISDNGDTIDIGYPLGAVVVGDSTVSGGNHTRLLVDDDAGIVGLYASIFSFNAATVAFGAGGTVLYAGGALGTPSSATLTNATGLPIGGINFLDTDGTLAANSDAKVPSQKAVKTYVDAKPAKSILSVACWGFGVDAQEYIPMEFLAGQPDYFVSPGNSTFPPSNQEYRTEFIIPYDCTLRNLYVRTAEGIDTASPTTDVTVRKNAADTSLALTVPTATHTTASDTTHSVSFSAGDRLTIKVRNSDPDYPAQYLSSLTVECDSP